MMESALIAQVSIVTIVVGIVMVRLGLSQGLLQLRKVPRRCPACGRLIKGAVCGSCRRNPR
jgi:hypothetical protein